MILCRPSLLGKPAGPGRNPTWKVAGPRGGGAFRRGAERGEFPGGGARVRGRATTALRLESLLYRTQGRPRSSADPGLGDATPLALVGARTRNDGLACEGSELCGDRVRVRIPVWMGRRRRLREGRAPAPTGQTVKARGETPGSRPQPHPRALKGAHDSRCAGSIAGLAILEFLEGLALLGLPVHAAVGGPTLHDTRRR